MKITKIRKVLGYVLFALVLQYLLTGCKETPKYDYRLFVDTKGEITRVRTDSFIKYITHTVEVEHDYTKAVWWTDEDSDSTLVSTLREWTHDYMLSPATESFTGGKDYVVFFRPNEYPERTDRWEIARFASKDSVRVNSLVSLLGNGLHYEAVAYTLNDLDNPYDRLIDGFNEIMLNYDTKVYRDSLTVYEEKALGLEKVK